RRCFTLFPYTTLFRSCMMCIQAKSVPTFTGGTKKGPKPLGYLFVCIKFQILAIVFCSNAFLRLIAETAVLLQLDTSVPPFSGERSEEHTSELQSRENL